MFNVRPKPFKGAKYRNNPWVYQKIKKMTSFVKTRYWKVYKTPILVCLMPLSLAK